MNTDIHSDKKQIVLGRGTALALGSLIGLLSIISVMTLVRTNAMRQEAPDPGSIVGVYRGSCTNTTYGVNSEMGLTLDSCKDGAVHGEIRFTGQLRGSGDVDGFVDGNRVILNSAGNGLTITWRGTLADRKITGTYQVAASKSLIGSTPVQNGTWMVER